MKTQVWYASVNVGTLKGDGPKLKLPFVLLDLQELFADVTECRCLYM